MSSHLQPLRLTLKTLSPVFIGSGRELSKKEYIFIPDKNPDKSKVIIPDYAKFARFLAERNLIEDYAAFLTGSQFDLFQWLRNKAVNPNQFAQFAAYEVYAGDAVIPGKPFKGIQQFIKDKYGKPYIPGSSLKGALRTAILAKLAADNPLKSMEHFAKMSARLERDQFFRKDLLRYETEQMEADFLHTLNLKHANGVPVDKSNAVNSALKGLQVSDSLPLETDVLTLCAKRDIKKNGEENALPICRECIRPGVYVRFLATVDEKILATAGIDTEFIKAAIAQFAAMQARYFSAKFRLPQDAVSFAESKAELFLGGGAGYVSKTVTYALGSEKALGFVSRLMARQFRGHKHEYDEENGVSPHMAKYTSYQRKMYPFGRCEVSIEKIIAE